MSAQIFLLLILPTHLKNSSFLERSFSHDGNMLSLFSKEIHRSKKTQKQSIQVNFYLDELTF